MGREKRILVVEDDDAIRTLLLTVLRRRGLKIDAARNGVEALERLKLCRYSVVLLDLMMPRMSGYELLDTLAKDASDIRPLVIVLTAGLEPRVFDTRLVVGLIHKPFDIQLLIDTVIGCLNAVDGVMQRDSCTVDMDASASPGEDAN